MKTQIENKEMIETTVNLFVASAEAAANKKAESKRKGAWAIAHLLASEDAPTLDEAFGVLKEALADSSLTSTERNDAVNGTRVWVPCAVHMLDSLPEEADKEKCPPKGAWPSFKRVKAIHGGEKPSEMTFAFKDAQKELVEEATESLANQGVSKPNKSMLEDEMISLTKTVSGDSSAKAKKDVYREFLAFINDAANMEQIKGIIVAATIRQKSILEAQAKLVSK